MTNGSNDQLGQIKNDLETVKEIMLAVARRAEATDSRLDRLAESTERTQEQLDQLREDVDIAFQTINLMSENGDRERAEFRAEILRIWEYLMGQQRNGNGDRPQT